MIKNINLLSAGCSVILSLNTLYCFADNPNLGQPLPGLSQNELNYYLEGQQRFMEVNSVSGNEPGSVGTGLGPRYNMTSCAGCHAHPNIGGSSPAVNPQVAAATTYGAKNKLPYFITIDGPVREVRFKFNPDGSRDGGVHDLYVITGRADAGNCNIAQPDFDAAAAVNNISFRIPTPLFGLGLIEAIPDSVILANKNSNQASKKSLGILGRENRVQVGAVMGSPNISANDGTISRFGWKAQNKSLLIFAGEAYNVEQGVTNDVFPNERDETPGCVLNGIPEDYTRFDANTPTTALSDTVSFTHFMRYLAPLPAKPLTDASKRGQALFAKVGCNMCHTPSMTTGKSTTAALNEKIVNLYSDLLLHHMGPGLADNINQGSAGPDEFRTAPLWGLGSRLFFLHDGRTSDLTTAILAHASTNSACSTNQTTTKDGINCASEANIVINNFKKLSNKERNDLLEFLKSL
ncbi:MAG: thiol oxidoreductase [Proteobacteria bacterium]|nr:thiol oxidoreductase [Pseudomonadota bacterium]